MKKMACISVLILLLLQIIFINNIIWGRGNRDSGVTSLENNNLKIDWNVINLTVKNMLTHIKYFSELKSRFTGYPGNYEAAKYVLSFFNKYLDDAYYENFTVTVPVDYGASLTLYADNKKYLFKAYTVYPNLVETCTTYPEGVSGRLVYAGHGGEEITGIPLNGSIVLMDFESGYEWTRVLSFGAKAVIFIVNNISETTTRGEAVEKFSMLPIDFPRIAIDKNTAEKIFKIINESGGEVSANIRVKMEFENRLVSNVIGIKEGKRFKDEIILFVAYFDSWSVTPAWSPGADESIGISMLLELARYISNIDTQRTFVFLAANGHHQALAGAREFLYLHLNGNNSTRGPSYLDASHVKIVIGLDPSAYYNPREEGQVAIFDAGASYHVTSTNHRLAELSIIRSPEYGLENELRYLFYNMSINFAENMVSEQKLSITPYYEPGDHPLFQMKFFDIDPFIEVEDIGFVFTSGTSSPLRGTPADIYSFVEKKVSNVWPHIYLIFKWAKKLATYGNNLNINPKIEDGRFRIVNGFVEMYDEKVQQYRNISNALVVISYAPFLDTYSHTLIIKTDRNGRFVFRGASSRTDRGMQYLFAAYKDEPSEGAVEYAPDVGENSLSPLPLYFITAKNYTVRLSVFKCASILLFDIVDPEVIVPTFVETLIVNHDTQNGARYFGPIDYDFSWYTVSDTTLKPIAMIYISPDPMLAPGPPWDIIIYPENVRDHLIILTNSGNGIIPYFGQQIVLHASSIIYAREFIRLANKYLEKMRSHQVMVSSHIKYYELAIESLKRAEKALNEYDYLKADSLGIAAWSYARSVYLDLRKMSIDISSTAIIFLLLAIPFAFLSERLLFDYDDLRKRSLAILIILLISTTIMYLVHPAFLLASSAPLIAISYVLLFLSILPLGVVSGKVSEVTTRLRKELMGLHFSEISRASALLLSASMAARNLRRRRLRTSLSILSTIIVVSALVSTVSVSASRTISVLEAYKLPESKFLYNGLLISRGELLMNLPPEVIYQIKGEFGDLITAIAPRVYLNPGLIAFSTGERIASEGGYLRLLGKGGEPILIEGILGLSVSEKKVTKIDKLLVPGSRYFLSDSEYSCIISKFIADQKGLNVGDYLTLWTGDTLQIVGLFDDEEFKAVVDINGENIAPLGLTAQATGRGATPEAYRISPTEFIIVPYKLALKLRGAIFNVAVVFKDKKYVYEGAERLAARSKLNVIAAVDGWAKIFSKIVTGSVIGGEIILPTIIIVFIILNTGLGAVYERKREVNILSSVGLSPQHVAGLFLAEFLIIGVISGFIGYLLGVFAPHFVPGLSANTSSVWVTYSVGASILIMLAAAAYPIQIASKSVTPSLERKWRIETVGTRRGDTFIINIPVLISPLEIDGLIYYLVEYLNLFKLETEAKDFAVDEVFVTEEVSEEERVKKIDAKVRVKPFDYGVTMDSIVNLVVPAESQTVRISLILTRLSGVEHVWLRGVRKFADAVRKQLLMWRSLPLDERRKYIRKSKEFLQKYFKL